jgi:hypothetical protein
MLLFYGSNIDYFVHISLKQKLHVLLQKIIWPAACRGIFTVQLGCPAWNALVAREGRTVKKGGKNVAAYFKPSHIRL